MCLTRQTYHINNGICKVRHSMHSERETVTYRSRSKTSTLSEQARLVGQQDILLALARLDGIRMPF